MSRGIGALASSIRPTGAYLPRSELAAKVLAPPYENQAGATGIHRDVENPLAFLNALRAEIDLPLQTDEGRKAMLVETVKQLHDLLAGETFEFYAPPAFFVCRLEVDGHAQTGVIADVALDAYDRGLVKVHELTRRGQEDRLFEYMGAVRASFLPIFLIHRPLETVTAVIGRVVAQPPTIDVESDDGLKLTGWAIPVDELDRVDDAPEAGSYLMRLAERWYRVAIPDAFRAQAGVAGLDVSVLHDQLLAPLLGIDDARTDPRIEFVPGTRGMDELDRLCRGPLAVSFALHPMSVADLMDVSDRNELLPPKSTYFVPKLRSGLIVRLF